MAVRRTAVAGTWYPSAPDRLAAEVAGYIEGVPADPHGDFAHAALVALVSPHAGLIYSGPVAAHSYQLLRSRSYQTIVLVGPSHYVGFEGASIWPHGAFDTPLGALRIDAAIAARIARSCPLIQDLPAAHAREHSLEMQLPFLASLAPQTSIVPIVMGHQTRETAFGLAAAIASAVQGHDVLLVASSDLSHFYDARTAAALDRQVLDCVAALDADGLMSLLERRPDHACGGGPMVAVMSAATRLGANQGRVIHYGDSSDVSGDKSSVVGYMAAAMWRT